MVFPREAPGLGLNMRWCHSGVNPDDGDPEHQGLPAGTSLGIAASKLSGSHLEDPWLLRSCCQKKEVGVMQDILQT